MEFIMSEEFANRIKKLMTEAGYQAYGYGKQNSPVQTAVWPDTSSEPAPSSVPSATVTDGSTTPMGEPRSDMQAQENGGDMSAQEVMGEVASLLISIGFILQQAGLVTDKYDTQGVIGFLTQSMGDMSMGNPTDDATAEVDVVAVEPQAGSVAPVAPTAGEVAPEAPVAAPEAPVVEEPKKNPYMESRKLLESKFKNFKKKVN